MYRVLVADDEPIERMIVGRTIKKYFSGQLEVVEAVKLAGRRQSFLQKKIVRSRCLTLRCRV